MSPSSFALIVLAALFQDPPPSGTSGATPFERSFADVSLRIDYVHYGTASTEGIALDALRLEGPWPGSRTHTVEMADLGQYQACAFDASSGELIFKLGYCTVFGEWQTTDEARSGPPRAFHESVRMPYPRSPFVFRIDARGRTGKLAKIFETRIDPRVAAVHPTEPFTHVQLVKIREAGALQDHVDLLIVGDGYADEEAEKFTTDAQRLAERLFRWEPFASWREAFNIRAIRPAGDESGIDEPKEGIYRRTAVGSSFNALNLDRYLLTLENRALRDLAAMVPYDTLIIMANSKRYGGGGIFRSYAVAAVDHPASGSLLAHEFGHSFAGLGDEYVSGVTYNDFYPEGIEPWEPNLTALLDRERLKWREFLSPGTPLPTPAEDPAYREAVGAFEGAGYRERGLFRSQRHCLMRDGGETPLCAVCRRVIEAMIKTTID
ncbi:MAG: M64 family metallopeptidase [Planctomycetota bacterium]